MRKVSDLFRFLGGLVLGLTLLGLLVFRVTSCAPARTTAPARPGEVATAPAQPPGPTRADCRADGWTAAAEANSASLRTLAWSPFGRAEVGWEIYLPIIQHEVGTACPPDSEGFAAAYAAWERSRGFPGDGRVSEADFIPLKTGVQTRREFVRFTGFGGCPDTADQIVEARQAEGYAGKVIHARPKALAAYRRMVADAKAEVPEIAADPRNLTIFSGYRSPNADAARCATEGNCDGVVRARCSAHRTGLAFDLYVGQAPGYGPDSSADPNRLFMSRTPTYRWLVLNAERYGFVNYPFEPWHWEWTGEPP